jgi:cation-transporting ATPase 13A1
LTRCYYYESILLAGPLLCLAAADALVRLLKRMYTMSSLPSDKVLVAVTGAPEMIKWIAELPEWHDVTYKWYTRPGSRVLALGTKEIDAMPIDKVSHMSSQARCCRDTQDACRIIAQGKSFVYYGTSLIVEQCIMITGDNPRATTVHVTRNVEIVDRDALILDLRENPT